MRILAVIILGYVTGLLALTFVAACRTPVPLALLTQPEPPHASARR